MKGPKRTVLHKYHLENGANMAPFAGYDMPLWFKNGVKSEHLAVINDAGIFDTSHMAVVLVQGAGAKELLQYCFTKDLDSCIGIDRHELGPGKCVYGLFLHDDGSVLDDAILYHLQRESYMVVVNAGMGKEVADHLRANVKGPVIVEDLTDRVGKMDIQGPRSARIMRKILQKPEEVLSGMVYFSFKGGFGKLGSSSVSLGNDIEIIISRTGYTGEFGFELYMEIDRLPEIWTLVLTAGEEFGAIPCGLASRDSLRAGAMLPLAHQDIGSWPFANNPWLFALPYTSDHSGFSKDFIGRRVLEEGQWQKHTLAFAGFDPRKISDGETSYVADESGEKIGVVLTCTTDMAIDRIGDTIHSVAGKEKFVPRGLSCGFVLLERRFAEGEIVVLADGKREIKVEIREEIRPNRTARRAMASMLV